MVKEYGGYLPLELPKGNAYYQGEDVVALNSGRYAIVYALQETNWDCIYLPYYICNTVREAISRYLPGIRIRYYHIGESLLPVDVTPGEREGLLWVNYFGIQTDAVIDRMADRFSGHLIIDHTQAFFAPPRKGVFQVYSCRKFFGVSDGSYVIKENISHRPLPQHYSSLQAAHLLHSLEFGTNYAYALNKENERQLGAMEPGAMSPLTSAILQAADYEAVKERRIRNMEQLHEILGPYNRLPVTWPAPAMSYPFLCPDPELRTKLLPLKIYVPQLWAETARNPDASSLEVFLSEHLCVLPVDQRYGKEDMQFIGNTVLELLKHA